MAVSHLDRLSATDASFLNQESDRAHMHIGAVLVFEGPPPSYDEFVEHVEARLHLVPRFRQKLAFPPLQSGRPVWVDDPRLNLEYHVRHSSLPAPGDDDQLAAAHGPRSSRSSSTARSRCGRCGSCRASRATASRSSARRTTRSWTASPASTSRPCCSTRTPCPVGLTPPVRPWEPQPEPSDAHLLARGVENVAKVPLRARPARAEGRAAPARDRRARARGRRGARRDRLGAAEPGARRAAQHRRSGRTARYRWVHSHLDDFRIVKDTFGGTVNDVVLAVVGGRAAPLAARRAASRRAASSCARSCRSACAPRRTAA